MADVAPLDPLRYDPALYAQVVAPPYDVIDAELRSRLARKSAHNVVHLDLPEGEGDARYDNAKRLFSSWRADGVVRREGPPAFWRFAQTFDPPGGGERLTRRGFFALVRAVPFSDGVVLPHERTLTGPKLDRLKLSRATRATLSPQFMLYSDPEHALEADLDGGDALADFETEDGVRHQLWRVSEPGAVQRIVTALASARLLIADGHHRYETAVGLAREIDEEARAQGIVSPRGEHLYTPALLANGDDPSLVVFPTHRLIHSLASFDFSDLIERAGELFVARPLSGDAKALQRAVSAESVPAVCAVGPDGRAVLLTLRDDVDLAVHPVLGKRPAVVRQTGVALLHDGLLEHVLGITPEAQAQKTNIRYLQSATDGIQALQGGSGQVLFLMRGTPVSVVRRVAEAGEVMPQKSTFFHPKVPTGLFFHTLDPSRSVG